MVPAPAPGAGGRRQGRALGARHIEAGGAGFRHRSAGQGDDHPLAFAVVKDASRLASAEGTAALEKEVLATVDSQLGAIARPKAVHFVTLLPKTRSGKTLRRSIQALAEGRDPGDLTTIEDPNALQQIKECLGAK